MKKSNLVFAIALCVIFFIPSLIQVLPFGKDLGWVSCFAQSPAFLWAQRAGGTDSDYGYSCSTDASGNIIATGYFYSSSITFGTTTLTNAGGGYGDMFIVKLNGAAGIEESAFGGENVSVYPNPSTGMFSIQLATANWQAASIEIYNVLGEKVFQSIINKSTPLSFGELSGVRSIINLDLPNGVYFLNIKTDEGIVNKKIIIQK